MCGVERENTLKESHKLYESLKEFMQKLPNHTIKEKLTNTKRALTAKTKKLKALAAEVKANQIDVKNKELDIQEYRKCILQTKQELLLERREKTDLKKVVIETSQVLYPIVQSSSYRTVGAGFHMPSGLNLE